MILSRGRLGYIASTVLVVKIFFISRGFGGNWEGMVSSFIKPIMGNSSGCFVYMLSSF